MNKEKIIAVFGGSFAPFIAKKLNERGLTSTNGKQFNRQIVLAIIDGRTIHVEAMKAIKEIVDEHKKEVKKLSK